MRARQLQSIAAACCSAGLDICSTLLLQGVLDGLVIEGTHVSVSFMPPKRERGDGYVMLARVKATTADSPYGAPGDIRCAAFCIEEDRLYVHAKVTRKFVFLFGKN